MWVINKKLTRHVLFEKYNERIEYSNRLYRLFELSIEEKELQSLCEIMVGNLYRSIVAEEIRSLKKEQTELREYIISNLHLRRKCESPEITF